MTDITEYIPHRKPFILVDDIIESNNLSAKTSYTIRENSLFVRDGFFTEPGLVENMAQAVAANAGYQAISEKRDVTIGYIGALKNLIINSLPAVGDTLITEVSLLHCIMNVHVVQGKVFVNDNEMASCEMKIFIQPS